MMMQCIAACYGILSTSSHAQSELHHLVPMSYGFFFFCERVIDIYNRSPVYRNFKRSVNNAYFVFKVAQIVLYLPMNSALT